MMRHAWVAAIVLLVCGAAAAASFSIAMLGDTPCPQDEEARFKQMLREIDGEDVAFIVYVSPVAAQCSWPCAPCAWPCSISSAVAARTDSTVQ